MFPGLPQQALTHSVKGRDILLAPRPSHDDPLVVSQDSPLEVTCQLAMAHCIAGQVHTTRGEYPQKLDQLDGPQWTCLFL